MNNFNLNINELKSYIDINKDQLMILPEGYFIVSQIISYLKENYQKLGYEEGIIINEEYIFSSSINELMNVNYDFNKISINNNLLKEQEINLLTNGKYIDAFTKARFNLVSLIDINVKLGEKLINVPFISGRDQTNKQESYIILFPTSNNGFIKISELTYLGYINNMYYVKSNFNINNALIGVLSNKKDDRLFISPKLTKNQIVIKTIKKNEQGVTKKAKEISNILMKDFSLILDETELDNESEYIKKGISLIIKIGPMNIKHNSLTFISSVNDYKENIYLSMDEDVASYIHKLFDKIETNMYYEGINNLLSNNVKCKTFDELVTSLNNNKISKVVICDSEDCLNKLDNNKYYLLEEFNQRMFSRTCIFCGNSGKRIVTLVNKTND